MVAREIVQHSITSAKFSKHVSCFINDSFVIARVHLQISKTAKAWCVLPLYVDSNNDESSTKEAITSAIFWTAQHIYSARYDSVNTECGRWTDAIKNQRCWFFFELMRVRLTRVIEGDMNYVAQKLNKFILINKFNVQPFNVQRSTFNVQRSTL